jgi:nicotinamidase-related amidase
MFHQSDLSMPGHYLPSQTALLLLDFHNFNINMSGSKCAAPLAVAAEMRTWAKSQGIHIIHCLVDINDTVIPTLKDPARITNFLTAMRTSGGEEAEVLLENSEYEMTFTRKPGYVSALKSPGLQEYLEGNGVKSLIMTGLSTSGCVMRTALAAADEEFIVTVIRDACADRVDHVHDLLVGSVLGGRAWVCTGGEFRDGYQMARTNN